jgi:hypothetical protein
VTTAEVMALAVLKGDLTAARALAESLMEDYEANGHELPPVTKITAPIEKVRVAVYLSSDETDQRLIPDELQAVRENVLNWLRGDANILIMTGIDRIELYELPDPYIPRNPYIPRTPPTPPVGPPVNSQDFLG